MSQKPQHPCPKDCPGRRGGCAVSCEKWQRYEKERQAFYNAKKQTQEQVQARQQMASYKKYQNSRQKTKISRRTGGLKWD